MIAKITHGWRPGGLLRYLLGPGRFNEHTNARVVDSWDGVPARQPPRVGRSDVDVGELAAQLSRPAQGGGIRLQEPAPGPSGKVPRGPVWHCSLRNDASDPVLTDDQWRRVARDVLARTGIAPHGDQGACRWTLVRHADDHVHIAAVLVRQDTFTRYRPQNDYYRAREACQAAEETYGLTPTAVADRTAAPALSRAEIEKAQRRQAGEPSRVWLGRAARVAAVQSQDPETFLARLGDAGVLTRSRLDDDGAVVGYAVADPADRTPDGQPIWYAGHGLGRDLAMPQLAARWSSAPRPPQQLAPEPGERATVGRAERAAALSDATSAAEHATAALAAGQRDTGGISHAASDVLTALGQVSTDPTERDRLRHAADVYDRAARAPRVGQPQRWSEPARALRTAAWRLAAVQALSGRGADAAGAATLIVALTALAAEIAAYHAASRRAAQAAAARRAETGLAGSRPPDGRPHRGDRSARPSTQRAPRRDPDHGAPTAGRPGPADPRRGGPPQPGPDHSPDQDRDRRRGRGR